MKSVMPTSLCNQAYESEVMIHSEAFTSATLQRIDASLVSEPHVFFRDLQMVEVYAALATCLPRGQASATFSKTSGTPLSRSSPNTGSTTQPGQHGRYEAAHLSCRTSTLTTSWQRQSLFCSHQDYSQTCRFTRTSPFAWGFSATCCSWPHRHCRDRFPHRGGRTNTMLWYLAPPTNRSARRLAFENL